MILTIIDMRYLRLCSDERNKGHKREDRELHVFWVQTRKESNRLRHPLPETPVLIGLELWEVSGQQKCSAFAKSSCQQQLVTD
jgi:hypothetical protein